MCKTQITVLERAQSNGGSTLNTLHAHFTLISVLQPLNSPCLDTLFLVWNTGSSPLGCMWFGRFTIHRCGADEQSYMNITIVNCNTLNYSTPLSPFLICIRHFCCFKLFYCFMRMLIAILFFNNNEKLCSLDFINGFIKKMNFVYLELHVSWKRSVGFNIKC